MIDTVGILRARLTSSLIISAANSSVGHISRWATMAPSRSLPHSVSHGHGRQFDILLSMGTKNVESGFTTTCELGVPAGGSVGEYSSKGDSRLTTGFRTCNRLRTASAVGEFGFRVSATTRGGGRRSPFVCSARRGFLSELQSLREEKEEKEPVEFESPLQIVLYPDPRLRKKNKRVTVFDEKLQQLVKEMFEIMYNTDGVGLAAPQVGVNVQLMLYNPEGERGQGQEYILVNPKIVKYGKQTDMSTEGCLSFLTLEADVDRPLTVRVEAQDIRGKKFGLTLKGWQARIFQHEYDHLEGVLYHDRMTPVELDKIRSGLVRLEEEYEKRTGQPAPERVKRPHGSALLGTE
ncbi:unnamed protein product [Calypogeia fissa]